MGDDNLSKDEFFRKKIEEGKDGYMDIQFIMQCNKIKKLGVKSEEIVTAIKDSELVEASEDGSMVRRKDNKALPEQTGTLKKRDQKAEDKKGEKAENGGPAKVEEEQTEPCARDDLGRLILS